MNKTKKNNARETFHSSKQILKTLFHLAPYLLLTLIILQLIAALIPMFQLFITKELINRVTLAFSEGSDSIDKVIFILICQLGLHVTNIGQDSAKRYVELQINNRMSLHYNELISRKATGIPLNMLEQPEYYNQLQRISSGGEIRGIKIITALLQVAQNLITIIGYIVILASFHWMLCVGMLILIAPSLFYHIRAGNSRYFQLINQTPLGRKSRYLSTLLRSREVAKEIRIFGLTSYLLSFWKEIFKLHSREKLELERTLSLSKLSIELFIGFATTCISGFLVWLGIQGRLTLGHFVALTQTIASTQALMQNTAFNIALIYENSLYTQDLMNFLELNEDSESASSYSFPVPFTKGIKVEELTFKYPNKEHLALDNVSFSIKTGEKIAIVGENGSGKSTLVKCLLGLYKLEKGCIMYDERNLSLMDKYSFRQHVTAVFQDFAQYHLSLRENIGFGKIEHIEDEALLQAAATKAGVDEIVTKLPNGYDTQLGPTFLDGHELSHGQWQKVAISRAFFRNFEVIILDEPTASLDPVTEAAIFERLSELTEGKTVIYISHRLGVCKTADRIVVMKQGRLIEQGTHTELIQENGEYKKMFQMQAQWYR
ncbi:ABC transporter ATP-binding protein [Paenibacillus eucommiae]|uniref:ATP-binding cassette subfamily B protein n=1 Tax=Paenibacillus eucommiae TaxID=1355755 RepID=A0ABS4J172_9BACL|nr:ABC transporter ATP-binding protein [Paenibacillus eucommiae]MBP1993579.1 ATP-binding cassette subfamily B protein [Paenibacillus eucommiae]